MMGAMSKSDVFSLLDYFHSQGGNFIDTSNNYQDEQSEIWIGEWLASKPAGFRDQMVIATKFTTGYKAHEGFDGIIQSNFLGNNAKSLRLSVDASLKKLQTSYIDLLYLHWWDFTTSIPEIMHSLNTLVEQGKVLYLASATRPPGSSPKRTNTRDRKVSASSSSTRGAGRPRSATSSAISFTW